MNRGHNHRKRRELEGALPANSKSRDTPRLRTHPPNPFSLEEKGAGRKSLHFLVPPLFYRVGIGGVILSTPAGKKVPNANGGDGVLFVSEARK